MKEKMLIIKRSGKKEQFNPNKIKNAIKGAFLTKSANFGDVRA